MRNSYLIQFGEDQEGQRNLARLARLSARPVAEELSVVSLDMSPRQAVNLSRHRSVVRVEPEWAAYPQGEGVGYRLKPGTPSWTGVCKSAECTCDRTGNHTSSFTPCALGQLHLPCVPEAVVDLGKPPEIGSGRWHDNPACDRAGALGLHSSDYCADLATICKLEGPGFQSSNMAAPLECETFVPTKGECMDAQRTRDLEVHAYAVELRSAQRSEPGKLWHLDRLSQRRLPLDGELAALRSYDKSVVYVLDTTVGEEFGDEGFFGGSASFVPLGKDRDHGYHVGALVADEEYGLNKSAQVRFFKVCDRIVCPYGRIIAALNRVLREHVNDTEGTVRVVNMSLAGPRSEVFNAAVDKLSAHGIPVVVAAGNQGSSVAAHSPGSATSAISVGATSHEDFRWYRSNMGETILAPGRKITSRTGRNTVGRKTGTSMASPLVAAYVAHLIRTWVPDLSLEDGDYSTKVREELLRRGTYGAVTLNLGRKPLLFAGGGEVHNARNRNKTA